MAHHGGEQAAPADAVDPRDHDAKRHREQALAEDPCDRRMHLCERDDVPHGRDDADDETGTECAVAPLQRREQGG